MTLIEFVSVLSYDRSFNNYAKGVGCRPREDCIQFASSNFISLRAGFQDFRWCCNIADAATLEILIPVNC